MNNGKGLFFGLLLSHDTGKETGSGTGLTFEFGKLLIQFFLLSADRFRGHNPDTNEKIAMFTPSFYPSPPILSAVPNWIPAGTLRSIWRLSIVSISVVVPITAWAGLISMIVSRLSPTGQTGHVAGHKLR